MLVAIGLIEEEEGELRPQNARISSLHSRTRTLEPGEANFDSSSKPFAAYKNTFFEISS